MEKKLNHLLADLTAEYHKLQSFHWYIKGKDFFTVHEKLEEYGNSILEKIDEVAESILMLEGKPISSMKGFLKETSIEEAESTFLSSEKIFQEVIRDFQYLLTQIREVKALAEEKEIPLISVLMDDYLQSFTNAVWMMHQQSA